LKPSKPQVAEHLGLAPRQEPVPLQRRPAKLLQRGAILPWERLERILAVLADAEVEEMVRILVPAHVAPEVRIDDPHHDLFAEVIVERLDLGRQKIDGPLHDQLVPGSSPRQRGIRDQCHGKHRAHRDEPLSHPAILS
jgi:hypothetical protein